MKCLVTLLYWIVFLLTAPVCMVLGLGVYLVSLPFDPDRRWLHAFVCRWCFHLYLSVSPGWRVRVEGREQLPPGPCVLVANHQSSADIFVAMGLFHPFKFVAKASLFRSPIVGWLMGMMGYVPVRRQHPKAMDRMLEDCRRWLRCGMPVLIFPEGTYAPSRRPLPFKRGAFRLALQERVPVVPVVLEGTTDIVEGDGPWMNPRASVRVRVLQPLSPESLGTDDAALAEHVRALFLHALGQSPLPAALPVEERTQSCA